MDARESVDYFIGGDRGGKGECRSFCNGQKGINFSRKETGNVVRLSRIPGRGTDCFRFLRENGRGRNGRRIKAPVHFPEPEAGRRGPRLVEESMYRVYSRLPFLVYFWR